MNFIEIGKRAKTTTRDYDDLSDYEAGQAYALVYLKDDLHLIEDNPIEVLPALPELAIKTDAHILLGWRTSHLGKQIDIINKQYEKHHAIRQGQFDHSVSGERMLRAHYLEKAQYVLSVITTRAQAQDIVWNQQIGQEAANNGLDRVTYLAIILKTLDTDEQIRLRDETLKQDQKDKAEKDRLQREHEAKTTANKIAAATQAKLGRLQQERAIDEAHDKALREAHEIKIGNDPPELKKRRLAAKEQTIASLERQLDGLRREPREDDFRPEPRW
jgi:hypothetical protein